MAVGRTAQQEQHAVRDGRIPQSAPCTFACHGLRRASVPGPIAARNRLTHSLRGTFPLLLTFLSIASVADAQGTGLLPREDAAHGDGLRVPAAWGFSEPASEPRSPWRLPPVRPDDELRRASYPVDAGSIRVVPSVVYLPGSEARTPGVVAVRVEHGGPDDALRTKGEFGWSGKAGGSVEVGYRISDRELSLRAEDRPEGGAVIPGARAPGSTLGGTWTERLGARTVAIAALANDRLDFDGLDRGAASGRLEFRHRSTAGWNLLGRVRVATYRDEEAQEMASASVELGTDYQLSALAVSTVVREEQSSMASRGYGGRMTLRSGHGNFSASAYADVQQQATSVMVDIGGLPDLPAELIGDGVAALRPHDAVKLLRDRRSALQQHGFSIGSLRVDSLRMHAGVDLRWRDTRWSGALLGMRLAADELDGVDPRRAMLGQFYAAWPVFGEAQLAARYSNLTLQSGLPAEDSRTAVHVELRAPL